MTLDGRGRATLVHGDTPPSLNKIGSRGTSHWPYTRAKRQWQDIITVLLLKEQVPRRLSFVRVTATLRFPVVRQRDAGNHAWMLEKACGDALVTGRWLVGDTPEHFEFGGLEFDEELGPRQTILSLTFRL